MWTPRDYQSECIEAGLDALAEGEDTLLVVPTGGGKSGIIGTITRTLFEEFGLRIVSCAHVKELVGQAYEELIGMWEWAPAGVYSAGLGRKEINYPIVFAGIQSVFKKAEKLGNVDVLIIDEGHTIPTEGDGQYRQFIADLRKINPDMRVLILTATPYRLGHGRLDEAREKKDGTVVPPLVTKIAYEITMRLLIDDGWLAPLTTKDTGGVSIDLSGVRTVGGDYNLGQMSKAVDKPELIEALCGDIVARGANRRSWLIFTPGKLDAQHFHEEMRRRGYLGGVITDDTPSGERDRLITAFKSYSIRYLINCGVLTTGFDHKGVDLIAMARGTKSLALYKQICGRGTRPLYTPGFNPNTATAEERRASIAAGPKPNCLVLDYAKNIDYFGPVDTAEPRKPGSGKGDVPMKTCPQCSERVLAAVRVCADCDFEFLIEEKPRFAARAAEKPILSKSEPIWIRVDQRTFRRHEKWGSPPSVKVEYRSGMTVYPEWVAMENPKARGLAKSWWKSNGGSEPTPETVDDALDRVGELRPIDEIRVEADGKYWRVTGRRLNTGPAPEGEAEKAAPAHRWSPTARESYDLNDDIPF